MLRENLNPLLVQCAMLIRIILANTRSILKIANGPLSHTSCVGVAIKSSLSQHIKVTRLVRSLMLTERMAFINHDGLAHFQTQKQNTLELVLGKK